MQNQSPTAQERAPSDDLQPLIAGELEFAALCLRLSGQGGQGKSAVLQKLSRSARSRAACLRGICTLVQGEAPPVRAVGVKNGVSVINLGRCCADILQRLRNYESRRDDPHYGCVYDHFCHQLREELCLVLELIGSADKR